MRITSSPLPSAALVAALVAPSSARGQSPTALESPMLAALQRSVAAAKPNALADFWKAVAARKTPLVDTLAKDSRHVLVTFLYRGNSDTRDVVLVAGPNGIAPFTDPLSHMRHLDGTDVWYAIHRLKPDAEFFYQISVNPPVVEGDPSPMQLRRRSRPTRSIRSSIRSPATRWPRRATGRLRGCPVCRPTRGSSSMSALPRAR